MAARRADLGGFSWLSPAMVYQLFAPLLVILLGHGLIAREREPARVVRARSQHRAKRLPHQRAERMSTAFGRAGVFIEEDDQGPRMRCE